MPDKEQYAIKNAEGQYFSLYLDGGGVEVRWRGPQFAYLYSKEVAFAHAAKLAPQYGTLTVVRFQGPMVSMLCGDPPAEGEVP